MDNFSIGFIGAGNMGTAIMKGIASSSLSDKITLFTFDPDASKVEALSKYGVKSCSSESELTAA